MNGECDIMTEKCCVCSKHVAVNDEWCCEVCGGIHHPKCSGEYKDGIGEYPHEDEYSICKRCIVKEEKRAEEEEDNL